MTNEYHVPAEAGNIGYGFREIKTESTAMGMHGLAGSGQALLTPSFSSITNACAEQLHRPCRADTPFECFVGLELFSGLFVDGGPCQTTAKTIGRLGQRQHTTVARIRMPFYWHKGHCSDTVRAVLYWPVVVSTFFWPWRAAGNGCRYERDQFWLLLLDRLE